MTGLKVKWNTLSGKRAGDLPIRAGAYPGHPLWQVLPEDPGEHEAVEIRLARASVDPWRNVEGIEVLEGIEAIQKAVDTLAEDAGITNAPTVESVALAYGVT